MQNIWSLHEQLFGQHVLVRCQIWFGDHADGSHTRRIDFAGQRERLDRGHIDIGGKHTQDDAAFLSDVMSDQTRRLSMDILGLISDGISSDAGQIDHRQVTQIRIFHLQLDQIMHHIFLRSS